MIRINAKINARVSGLRETPFIGGIVCTGFL